jgi:hypothetical protein
MAIDAGVVLQDALKAAAEVLGEKFALVRTAATAQVTALVANAADIEANQASMTKAEYEMVKRIQTRALAGVLAGYEAIGIVAAEQAAEAAWNVVAAALREATGLAFI